MKEKFRSMTKSQDKLMQEITSVIDKIILDDKYPDLDFDDLFFVLERIKSKYLIYWAKKAGWIHYSNEPLADQNKESKGKKMKLTKKQIKDNIEKNQSVRGMGIFRRKNKKEKENENNNTN
jgi:hypothetical protein